MKELIRKLLQLFCTHSSTLARIRNQPLPEADEVFDVVAGPFEIKPGAYTAEVW